MIRINLLPGASKRKRRQALIRMLSLIFTIFLLAVIGFAVVVSLIFSQNALENKKLRDTEKKITEVESEINSYKTVIAEASQLNQKLTEINTLIATYKQWRPFFEALAATTPQIGITYNSININSDNTMMIMGTADSPTVLAYLEANLKKATIKKVYKKKSSESIDALAVLYGVTVDDILAANRVANVGDIPAEGDIFIVVPLFSSVDLTTAALANQSDEDTDLEIERDMEFSFSLTVMETALQ
jgi:Tfp pilus assembly protein PilN